MLVKEHLMTMMGLSIFDVRTPPLMREGDGSEEDAVRDARETFRQRN